MGPWARGPGAGARGGGPGAGARGRASAIRNQQNNRERNVAECCGMLWNVVECGGNLCNELESIAKKRKV